MKVQRATPEDLSCLLKWLKDEFNQEEFSLWSNRESICEALEDGDLWVIREAGEAVAFQVGKHSPRFVNVRKDRHGRGYGTMLVEAAIQRASRDGIVALWVECPRGSSIEFWEKLGFKRNGDMGEWSRITLRRVIERNFELPHDESLVDVTMTFYSQAALGREVHNLKGILLDDGYVLLERRVVSFADLEAGSGDLMVGVAVNGVQLCFGKAKHRAAQEIGVEHASTGNAYYVEELLLDAERMSAVRETVRRLGR